LEKSTDRKASPNAGSSRSILKKTTEADCGFIEKPVLVPHLEFRLLGGRQALLVSETFNTLLHGQLVCDILPLLDGRRTRRDIMASLTGKHLGPDILTALTFLTTKGYIVSGEYRMEQGQAAYWSSQGVTPRYAEERLKALQVDITGDEGRHLARRLEAMGVYLDRSHPALSIIICADFLDERNAALNRRHVSSGVPWLLVRPKGVIPLLGPVFRPAEQGPCWACLAYRLQGQQEVHNFLRNRAGTEAAFQPFAAEPMVLETVSQNISRLIGPLMSGVLLEFAGTKGGFLALFLLQVVQIVVIVRLSADTDRKGRKKGRLGPLKDLLLGYRYSRRHPRISGVLIITFIMNAFAFSYQVLLPVFVRDVLFLGPLELGILGAGTGIGSILGIALIDRLGQHYRDGLVFTISSLVNALATLVFALSTSFPLSLIMLIMVGVGQTGFGIMQSSIVLRTSSDAMRPRVMGLLVLAIGGGPPGRLLVGGLAAVAGAPLALTICGGIASLGVVSVLWRVGGLRKD